MKQWLKFAVTCLSLATGFAHAGSISLGEAAKYNVFVKENFTESSSDTEGAVAIGGNLIINGQYDFGWVTANGNAATVTVKGNVEKSGNSWMNIYDGHTGLKGNLSTLVYGGTLNVAKGGGISGSTQKATINIDFNSAFQHLENLSQSLAAMTSAVGNATSSSTLTFTPAVANASNVYVFNITQADLNQFSEIRVDNKNISKDALIVFNVSNPTGIAATNTTKNGVCTTGNKSCVSMTEMNYVVGEQSSHDPKTNAALSSHVLFNFKGMNDVRIDSSIYGSILAPSAVVTAKTGVVWGQVMAKAWNGTQAQVNWSPLEIPPANASVSAPPVWLLMLLPLLIVVRRRPTVQQPQLVIA